MPSQGGQGDSGPTKLLDRLATPRLAAVERIWYILDSQDQIPAFDFQVKVIIMIKRCPLRGLVVPAGRREAASPYRGTSLIRNASP